MSPADLTRALRSLAEATERLEPAETLRRSVADGVARAFLRPEEEEGLTAWFARFLTVRGGLWEVIDDASGPLGGEPQRVSTLDDWRYFLLGYAAACLVVRLDRLLVEDLATDPLTQRKLNEGVPERRIPRKQFTAIFESLADPLKARAMERAMRFATSRRGHLGDLAGDPVVGWVVAALPGLEETLDPSRRRFLRLFWAFRIHALRRRGASARQQALFAVLETGGRLASELRNPLAKPRLAGQARREIAALLEPGDVLVTRHDGAFTNLFLPGYWPHAALYVGSPADRERLGIRPDPERTERWHDPNRVLEALKDGVLFRPLDKTLAVDAVAVIRPRVGAIPQALERAIEHEGKAYNFDFDFFRSDRLVCTELVYRAYDGLDGLQIPLRERAGRPTLAAEDLLDLAVEGRGFEPVAVFSPAAGNGVVTGEGARSALEATYRPPSEPP